MNSVKHNIVKTKNGPCSIETRTRFSGSFILLLVGVFIAVVVFAMFGCVQKSSVFGGRKLVLEFSDAPVSFDFPQGDEYCETRGENTAHPHRLYHRYDASKQEFYEESQRLNVMDGCGSSHWYLDFSTSTTGKATLIRKHPWAFRGKRIGFSVPFRVEPLSAAP